jgi:MFS family permease
MNTSETHPPRQSAPFYYGWVIVISCLVIGTVLLGTRHSFGVFFKSIETEFDLTRGATSAIFSVYMALGACLTVPWGWALDRYGPRITSAAMGVLSFLSLAVTSFTSAFWQLFVTYSLLLAVGTAATYLIQVAVISRWFVRKRGLALGIGGIGSGLGTLIMSPLSAVLISSLGWRQSYLVMAGIVLVLVVVPAMFLKRDPSVLGLEMDGGPAAGESKPENRAVAPGQSSTLREAMRSRLFWFLWVAYFITAACVYLVSTHLVPRSMDVDISPAVAAGILSVLGVASIAGRVLSGRASDISGRRLIGVVSGAVGAASLLWLVWIGDVWSFYVFGVIFGLAWGGIVTMITAAVGDVFGMKHLGAVMGVISIAWAAGAAVGPVVGGYIYDFCGNYMPAFLFGAVIMAAASILMGGLRKGRA